MTEQPQPWHASAAARERVEGLLAEMTLEEKVELVTGDQNNRFAFYNAPIERLGIPPLTMADGPAGVRINDQTVHDGRSTALPAPIALAATWNPEAAARYGDVLGAEARASGHNVQLGPAVDIARTPLDGRTFESFGEDPWLHAALVVPEIRALQAHGVQATIKHLLVNNQEHRRFTVDVRADERTLREIYLPPFEAAVLEGHVAAAMGSFNRIDGIYACEHPWILRDVLKGEWGFAGWVMSDYDATWSTVDAANAGLDQEQPSGRFWADRLTAAVRSGDVSEATIDDKVRRILLPMAAFGQLDRPPSIGPMAVAEHADTAREIAEQGIVLLENDGILPLDARTLRSIAVIGPEADNTSATGGGSGMLRGTRSVSPLDGIRNRAGAGVEVAYAPGVDPLSAAVLLPGPPAIPSDFLTPAGGPPGARGLRGRYWADPGFVGEPQVERIDPQPAINLGFYNLPVFNASSPKLPTTPTELAYRMSVRWDGRLTVPQDGGYELVLASLGTARLTIDGRTVIDVPRWPAPDEPPPPDFPPRPPLVPGHGPQTRSATLRLEAGRAVDLVLEYSADDPELSDQQGAQVKLGWRPPAGVIAPSVVAAADLAARSDVAIVVAADFETEMMDRPDLRLPQGQDELIAAVVAANPRTIVVLMSGAPIEVEPWRSQVAALVEAWYAGQEQGDAIARVLFGDVDATGRLPLTFPRSLAETPVSTPEQYPGIDGVATYSEGIFVGYRGYDERGLEPSYPFGFGRSYTSFAYRDLRIEPGADAETAAIVDLEIENTGSRAGTEVAQVYLGRLPGPVPTPPRQLAGWARVALEPGERRRVAIPVARRRAAVWDPDARTWMTPKGSVEVVVGRSSRDVQLAGEIELG